MLLWNLYTSSDERDFEITANVVYEIRVEETKESRDKAKSDKFLGALGGLMGTEENPNPLKGLFGSGTNIESLKAKIIQASVSAELKDLMNESVFEAEYNDGVKLPGDTSVSRMNQEAQTLIKNMLKMVGKNLASRVLGKENTGELKDNQMIKRQLEKERLKQIEERRLEVLEEQQYDEDGFN